LLPGIITRAGAVLVRHGGGRGIYKNPKTGIIEAVVRRGDIPERTKELSEVLFTQGETVNGENMEQMERSNEMLARLEEDENKPPEQRMGEKEIASMSLQTQLDTNRALRQLSYDMALRNELELVRQQEALTPPNPPRLSESWGNELFDGPSAAVEYH
jgi:hypothetical protein